MTQRLPGLVGLALLAGVFAGSPADAAPVMRNSGFEVWQVGDTITALAQSADGYLWIGTDEGVLRFDGVRFTPIVGEGAPSLGKGVTRLVASRDGGVWMALRVGGVVRWQGGRLSSLALDPDLTQAAVDALAEAPDGGLWLASGAKLARYRDGRLERHALPATAIDGRIHSLAVDRGGALWIGHEGGSVRLGERPAESVIVGHPVVAFVVPAREDHVWAGGTTSRLIRMSKEGPRVFDERLGLHGHIRALVSDEQGGLWVGTDEGLQRFADGVVTGLSTRDGLPHDRITALLRDREDSLWIATEDGHLVRMPPRRVRTLTLKDGLAGHMPFSVLEHPDGDMWIATLRGVNRVRPQEFKSFSVERKEFPSWCARSLAPAADGGVWVGTCDMGLVKYDRATESFSVHHRPQGFDTDDPHAMVLDGDGVLWIGAEDGSLWKHTEGAWSRVLEGSCPPKRRREDDVVCDDAVLALAKARDGTIWLGRNRTGVERFGRGGRKRITEAEGLPSNDVRAFHLDADGSVWVGTLGGGLARIRGDAVTAFRGVGPNVFSIVDDEVGSLWLGTERGVLRVERSELDRYERDRTRPIPTVLHNRADGMMSDETVQTWQPAGVRSRDGRLWFATTNGVAIFMAPARDVERPAPRVLLEEATLDGKRLEPGTLSAPVEVPPGRGDLQFLYAVPTFAAPHRVSFRYRLAGWDRDWVSAQDRRAATYTNIPPGRYTFEVRAVDTLGRWQPTSASMAFTLRPHFHQTWFFWALCALALAALAFGVHRVRVLQVRQRFAVMLAERNRIARDLHDSFAQGFTGIGYQLARLEERLKDAPSEVRTTLEQAADMVRHCQLEARQAIWNLRSTTLEGRTLRQALDELAAQARQVARAPLAVEVRGDVPALPPLAEEQLLRIAQEAVSNALAHAQPSRIAIELAPTDAGVVLTIEDDGIGFDATTAARASQEGHFGLLGMRERAQRIAAELTVDSRPGQGSRVKVLWRLRDRKAVPS